MTTFAYNKNLPNPPDDPADDVSGMQLNSQNIDNILGVDHINFNKSDGGFHTVIHEITQTAVNTVTGINQIFSGVPGVLTVNSVLTPNIPSNGDTQLYSLTGMATGLSGLSQLTGSFTTDSPVGDGNASFWTGGFLIQVSFKNLSGSTSQTGNVTFQFTFPNNCFGVFTQLCSKSGGTGSSNNTLAIRTDAITTSGFKFDYNGSVSNQFPRFFYIAIGN